ncbi:hypothetical protein BH11MYX1_BH11MYX1_53140 [soil metagenome]
MIVIASHAASANPRALVADSDAQLRAAITDALRPWAIEVSVGSAVPTTLDDAMAIADTTRMEYVIWREAGQLVVLDRPGNRVERRVLGGGALDAVTAAAAALSVKTMLRLAPLVTAPIITAPSVPHQADPESGWLRLSVLGGARFEEGLDSNLALRFGATLELRPWRDLPLRLGGMGDGGAAATVDQAAFHGRWSNWSILAHASWALRAGAWELAPWLAIGAEHSAFSGTEMMTARHQATFAPALRAGAALRYCIGSWCVGGQLAVEGLLSTTTYTALDGPAPVFEIPPIGAVLSLLVGTELGP